MKCAAAAARRVLLTTGLGLARAFARVSSLKPLSEIAGRRGNSHHSPIRCSQPSDTPPDPHLTSGDSTYRASAVTTDIDPYALPDETSALAMVLTGKPPHQS